MTTCNTNTRYSERITNIQPSCIREILKASGDSSVISFAGGLPNPALFPVQQIREATNRLLTQCGSEILQYSTTEGYLPLRKFIAEKLLRERGIKASTDQVMITSGSQQALDLIGKVFINQGDSMLMESPSYLSAIQAFQLYQPRLQAVETDKRGMVAEALRQELKTGQHKMLYTIPTFQNPTGLCYSAERRETISEMLYDSNIVFVEDDPYRDLRFEGDPLPAITRADHPCSILTSSFSKVISPGFRLGWIYSNHEVIQQLQLAKQASDLCTGIFTQRVMHELLTTIDFDSHVNRLCERYRQQRDMMFYWIRHLFPRQVKHSLPLGGMFIWLTLPKHISATELLKETTLNGVVFAPGKSFYPEQNVDHTMRINFSHTSEEQMEHGMRILAAALHKAMDEHVAN